MFRWCAYCQTFIGESEPLQEYSLTHGICAVCESDLKDDSYDVSERVLLAKELFESLRDFADTGRKAGVREVIDRAIGANLRRSDVLLGLIQPALYHVGQQWELGELTPVEENRFTSWCDQVLRTLEQSMPGPDRAKVLLVVAPDNAHNLGARFLALFLRDHGIPAAAATGMSIGEVVAAVEADPPAFLGVSVALPEMVPGAVELVRTVEERTDRQTPAYLGGFAFRSGNAGAPGDRIIQTPQELLKHLESVRPSD